MSFFVGQGDGVSGPLLSAIGFIHFLGNHKTQYGKITILRRDVKNHAAEMLWQLFGI